MNYNDSNFIEDIPSSWVITKMKNIGEWGAGATPLRSNIKYYNGNIPWLKTGELNNDYINDSQEKITQLALDECSLRINKPGDILIAMYGATIGKLGIANCELTTNQACCGCTPFPFIYNKYLFYYLMFLKEYFISISFGGAQPNISKEKILDTYIAFPKISEQIRICSVIESVFRCIDNIKTNYIEVQNYISIAKQKVLDSIFGPDSSYKSYYENKISITNDIEILDNLRKPVNSDERSKRIESKTELFPYYGATGQTGVIDDYIFEGEYVLLGEDGAPFLDKNAQKAYLIAGKTWVNNHAHVLKSRTNNRFLMYYLNWFDYFSYVSGTTRLKLNQAMLKKIPFPNMPVEIKDKIVEQIEQSYKILDSIN